jgi:orotate phosphoribosyltransferase
MPSVLGMTANKLQQSNLRNLIKTGAFRFIDGITPWFPYTSGQIGPYFVQSVCIEREGAAYARAIRSLIELIRAKVPAFDVISGGETRDWDFSNPVAVLMKKPHAKMYKDGRLLGADIRGKKVLHVADLNNEGSSVRDYWKPIVERNQGRFIAAVSFVDRLEDGWALFKKMKLASHSVVPLDKTAWDILLSEKLISREIHTQLVIRMKDRCQWALKALLANPEYFKKFYAEKATHEKALKIMRTYAEISDKLKEIVKSQGIWKH